MKQQETKHPILEELHELVEAFDNGELLEQSDIDRIQQIQMMCN